MFISVVWFTNHLAVLTCQISVAGVLFTAFRDFPSDKTLYNPLSTHRNLVEVSYKKLQIRFLINI